ncbi:fumarylacetoacetate hydrolase family protein [Sphingobium sp. HBC34]|uniref:Fumarylacetoacetate hydrolase family protein n=1 Tax=Sphingobium cyanobacteriorum TaxID=3063954 RepID=A0ABT8ZNN9_9SPHN|nr:fumarylacetoacetate hydrolase family protein [Sphingobium sp. HBC34]MDO7836145.1 fumarylacetoacetate hydrolase family protein [Sphingobium sp. HBC34]
MKLVTLRDGGRDGTLAVATRNLARYVVATAIAPTLQAALDDWAVTAPALRRLSEQLDRGDISGAPLDPARLLAPLPRAWQWLDASAFDCHGELMAQVFDMPPVPTQPPLMYQGLSHRFIAPQEDVAFRSEEDGIDFEGEFGVIVDDVPMGVSVEDAAAHICLLVQINDWSLRRLGAIEMKTGFGWIQAKPPCSIAPAALSPDELGTAWRDGRIDRILEVDWNGECFGRASGYPMSSSFPELIAHAAHTRALCAGTIIGSGTVSNSNYREVGSSCIAERRGIEMLDEGTARTPFMRFGDTVRMRVQGDDGDILFGTIEQKVIQA